MSSRNLARPIFPLPPEEYSREYMDRLVQSFAVYLEQYQNPGEGRTTKTVMTAVPTSPVDLEDGTVYVDSTILRIGAAGVPGTFVIPNLEVTGLLEASGTLDITGVFDIAGTTVTATAAELNFNDIITLGTVQENKTVTAGTGKAINFDDAPMTNVDINSGAIDGTPIGAASASTGSFTDLGSTGTATLDNANITTADITTANITTADIITANITTTFQLAGITVTASAAELNFNDITTLGVAEASKVVTASALSEINFNDFDMINVDINSGAIDDTAIGETVRSTGKFTTFDANSTFSLNGTAVTATAAELNFNDITTLGVAQASKVVTANASSEINFNSLDMINVDINSGSIDDTTIGASSAANGTFSVLEAITLNVTGIRFVLPKLTTVERDAIGVPIAGWLIYNTTTNKLNFYNGTAWEVVTSA